MGKTQKERDKEKIDRWNKASNLRYSLAKHGEAMYKNKDLLENLYVVRKYFSWKYNTHDRLLYLLLTLYPKGYFNNWDYKKIDKDFKYMHADKLIDEGWLEKTVITDRTKFRARSKKTAYCYGPTKKMHDFIDEFYGLLAGEYSFPHDWTIEKTRKKKSKKPNSLIYFQKLSRINFFDKDPNPKEIYFKDIKED